MISLKLRVQIASIVLLTFLFIATAPVGAQQKFTGLLLRTPAEYNGFTFEFFMQRGETRCDSFIAQHDFPELTKPYTYYLMTSDFEINPVSQQPVFPTGKLILGHQFSLASWITLDRSIVNLARWGVEQPISFCVTVPEDAEPGTHYAAILLSTLTVNEYLSGIAPSDQTSAALGSRSGVNVLVTVGGDTRKNVEVAGMQVVDIDFQSAFLNIFEYQPLNLLIDLVNDGNQFAKPAGNISIHTGDLATPEFFTPFNPEGGRVLPQTKSTFTTNWSDGPLFIVKNESKSTDSSGNESTSYNYRLSVDLTKIGEFRFGRYFATLQMLYYDSNGQLQRVPDYTVQFWIIPWKLILVALLIIITMWSLIRRNKSNKVKYISKKSAAWKTTQRK
jgi:hypothetical protein